MAKPIAGEPGSAMHIHTSVVDAKTGKNIFAGPKGAETEHFLNFIGGLQSHLGAAIAVIAPYVNSYRRHVPDFAALINLEYVSYTHLDVYKRQSLPCCSCTSCW